MQRISSKHLPNKKMNFIVIDQIPLYSPN